MVPTKRVRLANWTDAYFVWRLRNNKDVRAASFNQRPISLWSHLRWYFPRLKKKDCPFWIATVRGQRAGYLRLERSGAQSYVLSIAVLPKFRGYGVALSLVKHMSRWLALSQQKVVIYAHTRPENVQSQGFFRSARFREVLPHKLFAFDWPEV